MSGDGAERPAPGADGRGLELNPDPIDLIEHNLQFVSLDHLRPLIRNAERDLRLSARATEKREVEAVVRDARIRAALAGFYLYTWGDRTAEHHVAAGLRLLASRGLNGSPSVEGLLARGLLLKRQGECARNAHDLRKAARSFEMAIKDLREAASLSSQSLEWRARAKAAEGASLLLLGENLQLLEGGRVAASAYARAIFALSQSVRDFGEESLGSAGTPQRVNPRAASSLADRATACMRLAELQLSLSGVEDALVNFSAGLASLNLAVKAIGPVGRLCHTQGRLLTSRAAAFCLVSDWGAARSDFRAATESLATAYEGLHHSPAILLNRARALLRWSEMYELRKEWRSAEGKLSEAAELIRPIADGTPRKTEFSEFLIEALRCRSRVRRTAGHRGAAEADLEEAERRSAHGPLVARESAARMANRASLVVERMRVAISEPIESSTGRLFRNGNKFVDKLLARYPASTELRVAAITARSLLARHLAARGQTRPSAIREFTTSIRRADELLTAAPADPRSLALNVELLVDQLESQDKRASALRADDQSSRIDDLLTRIRLVAPNHLPGLRVSARRLQWKLDHANRGGPREDCRDAKRKLVQTLQQIVELAPEDRIAARLLASVSG